MGKLWSHAQVPACGPDQVARSLSSNLPFSRELALIRVAGDLDSTLTKKKRHG